MDPQVFGVLGSFPVVFVCASAVSALVILIVLQVTLNEFTVAFTSFLAANTTAALVGARLGPQWETWYRKQQDQEGGNELGAPAESRSVFAKHGKDEESRPIFGHPESESDFDGSTEVVQQRRNMKFYGAILAVFIIANLLGMIWGSWCAQHFPTRLSEE